ncbi:glycosyltransferase [Aeromonas caviae]|uniref:Glycosyltransferase n=1 Tax=Aeromonas caviae TaxID=648 RepID=A0AA42UB80_AERCA|nr:glycosyltransferase [Aeromonas caviae]MDH1506336.1 glycosyltransferase [Aeromonas caviae]MDH1805405.1 glycosyltransferase [Aeromonas caviae]BDN93098.1 dTDP-rhamnosyl transferase RfbG [Aeromonas caviae]GJA16477.1 dTDP-rhamnosyl transferase RfbG [Aeromonas caviae]GJA25280.1 dTDP-rhamnosyl transferase RfbG [Aeromonas caviae]
MHYMIEKKKVLILLAVFNGEKYLNEQVSSLLEQSELDIRIVISVDCSSDDSFDLCRKLSLESDLITVLSYGERYGGAGKNFYRLIHDVEFDAYDYIAFCDQDDIWSSDKISRAIESLQLCDCYSSNVTAFWSDGREVLIDKAQPQREWDYLFEAAGPGCTYVFRREFGLVFQEWLRRHHEVIANKVSLHDWLVYAFARNNGYSWYIDPNPSMRYRQHQNNQVGTNNSLAAAKKRLRLIKDKWYRNQIVSIAALLGLEDTPVVKYGLMNGYLGNLYLLININKLRRRTRDKIALAVVLLLNVF